MGSWGHLSHTPLQSGQSLYDPFSQTQGHAMPHPRLQGLAQDHMFTSGQSQSPEGESWYHVPFDDAGKPATAGQAGTHAAVPYRHSQGVSDQPAQPQVAVRDSNVDFDVDMGWSDDDAAPPLPDEPPPMPVSACPSALQAMHGVLYVLQLDHLALNSACKIRISNTASSLAYISTLRCSINNAT